MILWIAFAVVAAAAIAVLARPLLAEQHGMTASAQEADLAVYRDQLAEIDADRDRGLIDAAEAESARTELARRLLQRSEQSDDAAQSVAALPKFPSPATIAYATAATVPILAIAIYLALGSPSMPGMPQSARLHQSPEQAGVEELVAKVEAQLRETPEDGRGWDAIAPVYLRLRRFGDASKAFSQSIRLLGETPRRLRGFAESTVLANNGIVIEPARLAYQQILTNEPGDHEARFWLSMADEQEGMLEAADKGYRAVLADAPEDAPWKSVVEARIASIAAQRTAETSGSDRPASQKPAGGQNPADGDASTQPVPPAASDAKPPGPTSEDIAAARELSKDDQQAFINAMVERLADKLEKDPDDFDGWLRLVRAYSVLGRRDDADRALVSARKSAEGNSDRNARLDALASELGLGI